MNEGLSILFNPAIPEIYSSKIGNLVEQFPGAAINEFKPGFDKLPPRVETVIVFGGDGTLSAIVDQLNKRDEDATLFVVPAGTENGFYSSLINEGSRITERELRNGDFSKAPRFFPGEIEDRVFIHFAGFGQLLLEHQRWGERLRGRIPANTRQKIAGFVAFTASLLKDSSFNYSIDQVFISRFLGSCKFPFSQSIYSSFFTRISIDTGSKTEVLVKLTRLAVCVLIGKVPTNDIAKIEQAPSFILDNRSREAGNVDGEIIVFDNAGKKMVKRSQKGIRVAGIVTE